MPDSSSLCTKGLELYFKQRGFHHWPKTGPSGFPPSEFSFLGQAGVPHIGFPSADFFFPDKASQLDFTSNSSVAFQLGSWERRVDRGKGRCLTDVFSGKHFSNTSAHRVLFCFTSRGASKKSRDQTKTWHFGKENV